MSALQDEGGDSATDPQRTLPLDDSRRQTAAATGTIPGYELLAELSRGGQGIVYQAIQLSTRRKVAVKVLLGGADAAPDSRRRFQREIELLAQLRHPNIVSLYEAGVTDEGRQYFVMDFVHGQALDRYLATRKPSETDTMRLFISVCDAVHHAHQHGIVHRDLKPRNILVDGEGRALVLDFGLARPLATGDGAEVSLTQAALGTLPYMAPEQASGNSSLVDARTDIYALGVTFYRLLLGRFPYDVEGSLWEVLDRIQSAAPQSPRLIEDDFDADLETILLKCLAKEPSRRYRSADELSSDLRAYLEGRPISARRDRLGYLARKQAESWLARHPILAAAMITAASASIGHLLLDPILTNWTPLDAWFNRLSTSLVSATQGGASLKHTCILGLMDETPVESLARELNLEGVDPKNLPSLRRLHGRMLEQLAEARPRVVAFDIMFRAAGEFDEDLLRGIRRLAEQGIPVVLGISKWWADEQGIPELSAALAPHARWGCVIAGYDTSPLQIQLILQRGPRDPLPSLPLAAAAAFRQPEAEASYLLDVVNQKVLIRYQTSQQAGIARRWLAESDEIPLGVLRKAEPGPLTAAAPGAVPGDLIGIHLFHLPSVKMLEEAIIPYEQLFRAPIEERRRRLGGKVVVIGDLRSGVDRHMYSGAGLLPGCYGLTVGIHQLIQQMAVPRSQPWIGLRYWDKVFCGALGAVIGLLAGKRRDLLLAAAVVMLLLIGFGLALTRQLLWNPMVPMMVLTMAWAAVVLLKLSVSLRDGRVVYQPRS